MTKKRSLGQKSARLSSRMRKGIVIDDWQSSIVDYIVFILPLRESLILSHIFNAPFLSIICVCGCHVSSAANDRLK